MRDRRSPVSLHVPGGISLMCTFAVLCLTVFSVLTLSTVLADARLAEKSRNSDIAYYEADTEAQSILSAIRRGELPTSVNSLEDGSYFYSVPMDAARVLNIHVSVDAAHYQILAWQQGSRTDWTPDESITVWSGSEK